MAQAKKKSSIEMVDKEYRLSNDMAPLSWIIKTGGKGNLIVLDKETKTNRSIRHCINEKSVFIDEQSDHALLEPIVIEKGYLFVPASQQATQKFMDIHPDNEANGGTVFYEVDEDKEAEESLEREDLIIDLKSEVREVQKSKDGILKLQALVAVLKNSAVTASKMTSSELRREIFIQIDANPYRFTSGNGKSELFGEDVFRRHIALTALNSGVIRSTADGRAFIWADNKETITNVPAGVKPTDHLFEYLSTDDGILVIEEMQKRM